MEVQAITTTAGLSDNLGAQCLDIKLCRFFRIMGLQMHMIELQGHGNPPHIMAVVLSFRCMPPVIKRQNRLRCCQRQAQGVLPSDDPACCRLPDSCYLCGCQGLKSSPES